MFSDVRNFEELAAPGPTVYMGALMNPAGRPAVGARSKTAFPCRGGSMPNLVSGSEK